MSEAEVALKTFDRDTTADVLVLWENESVRIELTDNGDMKLRRFCLERIKILKDDGKSWGDFKFRLHDDYKETLSQIKVTTYNMSNGSVRAVKMPSKSVYKSREDNITTVSFSAPEVMVGSVIEISYELSSDQYWGIGKHYFQRSVPVNYTEFEVIMPEWLEFSRVYSGGEQIDHTLDRESTVVSVGGVHGSIYVNREYFRGMGIPAMKAESNVYGVSQYRSSVTYDLEAVNNSGQYKSFSKTWADVDKSMMESDIYRLISSSCKLKDEVDGIKGRNLAPLETVEQIRNMVLSKVNWNKNLNLVPGNLNQVLKTGSGDNADINTLFGNALKYAGFEVEPVLIRLRSQGMILEGHPSLNPFNTMILRIGLGDGEYVYVDAARKEAYYNLLPADYLVKNARIPRADGAGVWEDMNAIVKNNNKSVVAKATIDADGRMSGTLDMRYTGVPSFEVKSTCLDLDDNEKLADILERDMSVEVTGIQLSSMEDYSNSCSLKVEFEKDCDNSAGLIYVPVFINKFHEKSDFKSPERKYPVDFPYKESCLYSMSLGIPDGYVVEQLPESKRFSFPELGAEVIVKFTNLGQTVSVQMRYTQTGNFVQTEDYAQLRNFWDNLCSIYDSLVVLKKAEQ